MVAVNHRTVPTILPLPHRCGCAPRQPGTGENLLPRNGSGPRRRAVPCARAPADQRVANTYGDGKRDIICEQRRSQESTKPGLASSSSSSSFLQPLLAFFFLLMAVARAKPGLHVNHGRRGGWSTGSPPAGFVAGCVDSSYLLSQ